jgi:hypothetical protein
MLPAVAAIPKQINSPSRTASFAGAPVNRCVIAKHSTAVRLRSNRPLCDREALDAPANIQTDWNALSEPRHGNWRIGEFKNISGR